MTPNDQQLDTRGALIAIDDGVRGAGGGRLAAESTVRSLMADYYGSSPDWDIPHAIDKVVSAINSWLFTHGNSSHHDLGGMVTTLSLLVLRRDHFYLAHVGDTRVYRLRGGRFQQLTTDHVWPHRDMCHVLRRAVGLDESLVIDFCSEELQAGDMFLLMSDGVWEVLGEKTVGEILRSDPDTQQAANTLVSESIRYQAKYLGHNDATALVVRINSCGEPAAP